MAWPGERPPWGRGWGLPSSQGWGRARTSCPSVAEWVVRFVLSQSRQPWPECHGGCAGSQLRCWCTLEAAGVYWSCWAPAATFFMAQPMPAALPTKPGWPTPSLPITAVSGT